MKQTFQALARFARLLLLPFLLIATPLTAQDLSSMFSGGAGRPLPPDEAFRLTTTRAAGGALAVQVEIAPGYYLYRDRLTAETEAGAALTVDAMPGKIKDDPNFGPVEVWHDTASARVASEGGAVVLSWQGCQEAGICYPPQSRVIAAAAGAPVPTDPGLALAGGDGLVGGLISEGGAALVVLSFFGFGLLLAFTPCVLPMVPVVAGMLSARGSTLTPARGAVLTGAYVLAVALAFAALGLVAAWSGQNLQIALQSPLVISGVALLFVVLALASFGLFELQMPAAITQRLTGPGRGRGTLAGAFGLGLTSALVIGPCVTAPLAGALPYIAQTGDAVLGAAALFALGLGQGMPLMAVGLFGSAVLPKMGPWMDRVRALFGFVFLGFAIWMAGRVLPGAATLGLYALLLVTAGVFFGALDRLAPETGPSRRLATAGGLISLLLGAVMGLGALSGGEDPLRPLDRLTARAEAAPTDPKAGFTTVSTPDGLTEALAAAPGPALVYVTAEWCTTCRVIEREILPDPGVQAALDRVTPIAVDVTRFDAEGQALLDRLASVGPPTFLFLDAARAELPDSRLIGEFHAEDLVAALARLDG